MANETSMQSVSISMTSAPQSVVFQSMGGFKNFAEPKTIAEAISESGADFSVRKDHLIRISDEDWDNLRNGNGGNITIGAENLIHSHCATVREDNGNNLGVVGSNYGVVQNADAFKFVDFIVNGMAGGEGNKAVITSCGTLNGGSRMFVSAKLPNSMRVSGDNSRIDDYLLFTNSHDGSYAVQVMFTPVRVVCQNTLNLALRTAKNKLVYKHTRLVEDRMDLENTENMRKAIEVLKMHEIYKEEFIANLENLVRQKVDEKMVMKFASSVFLTNAQMTALEKNNFVLEGVEEVSTRAKNSIETLLASINNGVGQDSNRGTKLWLHNGLTTFLSNEKKWKTNDDKFNSLYGGSANRKVQDAFEMLNAM